MNVPIKSSEKPENIGEQVQRYAIGASWTALKVSFAVTITILVSVFLYGTFYYTYIPQSAQRRQLQFQQVEVWKTRKQPDGSTQHSSTKVLQADLHMLNEAVKFLNPGLLYSISLEMDMPDSDTNLNAGTFMVKALFYDKHENLLTSSSRLVMLRYRSWLLRILDTLVYAPFYLLGLMEQNQIRRVEIFKDFRENAYKPTASIMFEIDDANIQLYEAVIHFQVQFSGMRYWMYYWPITMTVFGVLSISFFVVIIIGSSWYTISGQGQTSHSDEQASSSYGKPSMEHIGPSVPTGRECSVEDLDGSNDKLPETVDESTLRRRVQSHDTQ